MSKNTNGFTVNYWFTLIRIVMVISRSIPGTRSIIYFKEKQYERVHVLFLFHYHVSSCSSPCVVIIYTKAQKALNLLFLRDFKVTVIVPLRFFDFPMRNSVCLRQINLGRQTLFMFRKTMSYVKLHSFDNWKYLLWNLFKAC